MIRITELQKLKEQKTILQLIDLEVSNGEIVALFGGVDSGKSELFQILIGRDRPTMGRVFYGEISPEDNREAFSVLVGVLFAENNLYQRQSVRANLNFYARLLGKEILVVDQVLQQVGLRDYADLPTGQLNSGLGRRLAFARALLHKPTHLILFEPFRECDEASLCLIRQLIIEQAAQGTAILILADESSEILNIADRVGRLELGKLSSVYSPKEAQKDELPLMLPVRLKDKVVLLDPADILVVFSQDEKIYIQTNQEIYLSQYTLNELEKRLSRRGFFRAHRAYLVNLQKIKEVIPFTRDSFSLRIKDEKGSLIPLSKSAEKELRELLGY